jgi:hypothetical protein
MSTAILFGWNISPRLSVAAGPSVVFQWNDTEDEYDAPLFTLFSNDFNDKSRVFLAARANIRLQF